MSRPRTPVLHWGFGARGTFTREGQKVLSPNILDYNLLHNVYIIETCIFTDSYESAVDMTSL